MTTTQLENGKKLLNEISRVEKTISNWKIAKKTASFTISGYVENEQQQGYVDLDISMIDFETLRTIALSQLEPKLEQLLSEFSAL